MPTLDPRHAPPVARRRRLPLALWVTVLDPFGVLSSAGGLRYGVLMLILFDSLRRSHWRVGRHAPIRPLYLFGAFVIIGSTIGIIRQTASISPGLILGVVVVVAATVAAADQLSWSPGQIVRVLSTIGTTLLVVHAMRSLDLPFFSSPFTPTHAFAPLYLGALFASLRAGRRWVLLVGLVSFIQILVNYPAATYLISAATGGVMLLLLPRRNRLRLVPRIATAGVLIFVLIFSILGSFSDGLDAYYRVVGKGNNSLARQALNDVAFEEIIRSPLIGRGYLEDTTIDTASDHRFKNIFVIRQTQLPVHNDLLDIGLNGGIFAITLWVGWFITCGRRLWRGLEGHPLPGDRDGITLGILTMSMLFATSLVNPVISTPTVGFACLYIVIVAARAQSRSA